MNKTNAELSDYLNNFSAGYPSQDFLDVVICPQMPSLSFASSLLGQSAIALGAQNMHYAESGAFTGETSPLVLKELGCSYVILGHSERRTLFGETWDLINKKLVSAIQHGIRPILCIGETLEQREAGTTKTVLAEQFAAACKDIDLSKIDLAYEPVWSIGTGKIPTIEEIEDIHKYLRGLLANTQSRILYGGSSNDQNAASLIQIPEVNGFLVGGAALDPNKFLTMINAITQFCSQ